MQKKFKELYKNLSIEYDFSKTYKKKRLLMVLGTILLLTITINIIISKIFVLPLPFILFLFLILELLIIYIGTQPTGEQNKLYREEILIPILKRALPGLEYQIHTGMSKEKYDTIGFPTGNIYEIKENIKIPFKSEYIDISNISIKNRYKFEKNSEHVFDGYICEFNIPQNISKKIKIMYNAIDLVKYQDVVMVDNNSFNQKYSLICEDEIYALRMFTYASILELMELYNKYRIIINLHIQDSKVYMQTRKEVGINDLITFKYKDVENKIKALEFIYKTSELIFNVIQQFEGDMI